MNAESGVRESALRSLLKAITYRVTGTVTTALVTFFVTGEFATALAVGSIEPFIKLIVYFVHERIWQRVPIGTVRRLAHLDKTPDSPAH
jgi:uncharacterized membrane protein